MTTGKYTKKKGGEKMDQNSAEYILDFIIPTGATGPTGPNPPLCYIDYNTSNNNSGLSIQDSKIYNSNGEFSVNDDTLTVAQGTYEITFCGKIDVSGDFKNSIVVSLHELLGGGYSQPVSGMMIILPSGMTCMQFSETKLIHFDNTKNIVALVSNNNSVTATVSLGSLILKKISDN